ncbi:hypothetical protein DB347_02150 [Opitutaceae bacterium EW11]|nr:hypothetical protein DB347_02150 [Opitutaceae bacterium EW11]
MFSPPFLKRASWIWSAEGSHSAPPPEAASPSHYQVRLFRRKLALGEEVRRAQVHVSADSRYILYCNGAVVGRGPAKGDIRHHVYDTHDLASFLRLGENVLAALVLDMSRVAHRPASLGAPCSVMTYAGGFLLEGDVVFAGGALERLDTGLRGWRVAVDTSHRFQNEGTRFEGYLGYFEHRIHQPATDGWLSAGFDDSAWAPATLLYSAERIENRRDPASPYGLVPRLIPPLEEGPEARFADAFAPGGGELNASWRALIAGGSAVTLPPGRTVRVVLDAGVMTTAFPVLHVAGGRGSRVRLTYAEALRLPWSTPDAKMLGRPQPLVNLASHFADEASGWTFDRRGEVTGWSDIWEPNGGPEPETFEPLHWRAFRYVGLEIATGTESFTLRGIGHRFTAYPYEVRASFHCSDTRLNRIWETSLRTMRLCSHETFEDCPHYEQMQYAGDTMVTSKLAMLTSGDYALSRQSLLQFDWSRLPEGLTQSRYPSRLLQVIPSWSLHWISTAKDYAYCSGDLQTVRELVPGILAVLDWFRRHAGGDGLPSALPFWNITDWCPWWERGVVPGADSGPTCIISAQYIHALEEASDLLRLVGGAGDSSWLSLEAAILRRVFNRRFWSEKDGLYFDRPGGPEISQYGNAWAIVCGAASDAERARMLERFPHDAALAPGSFFCWHTVFRALEIAGAYERMPGFLGPWHEMVADGLSTFAEENSYWRSLCHAWSAHPALDFLTRILGVTPRSPGFAVVDIQPKLCGLDHASGSVCTPRGMIDVAWRVEAGRFHLEVAAPADTPVRVRWPNGAESGFSGGRFREDVALS